MRRFAQLYEALDATNSTSDKIAALVEYFGSAPAADAAWCVHLLSGERLRSAIASRDLAAWAAEHAAVADWMFDACYETVGDRAETIALLVDAIPNRRIEVAWQPSLSEAVAWVEQRRGEDRALQRQALLTAWSGLATQELFLFNKLLTGSLRVGVAKRLVVRALAEWSGLPAHALFHRLMGHWRPSADAFANLFDDDVADADRSRPYPYFLASPLETEPEALGVPEAWQAEWKWDGIRAQLVRRGDGTWLWSRGEELISLQFPEIVEAADELPDGTVLDGEILSWNGAGPGAGAPRPFADLQRRIGRKRVGARLLQEVPCLLMVYDLVELHGRDLRDRPLAERRAALEDLLSGSTGLACSPRIPFSDWSELSRARDTSRVRGVEGLMLKHLDSPYRVGRVRGDWWKWKISPLEIDAVLMYAQPGHGRRAGLHTDYTFGVWDADGALVPVAKAYSGLDDVEIRELDRWIRQNTLDKFGPVRAVEARHVFELHFENVAASNRHKSGVAVRFPRIARWRRDRSPADANTLVDLRQLIGVAGTPLE